MVQNRKTPVISFVAASGSGKTTLLEKVIRRLKADGWKIGVIKHDAHGFEMDHPGKDTWRMAQAGADVVAISSADKFAVIEKVSQEKQLHEIIELLPDVDLILTEGFKNSCQPSIEVFRSEVNQKLLEEPIQRLALASDIPWDIGIPCYHIDNVEGIVSEIIKYATRFRTSPLRHNK